MCVFVLGVCLLECVWGGRSGGGCSDVEQSYFGDSEYVEREKNRETGRESDGLIFLCPCSLVMCCGCY